MTGLIHFCLFIILIMKSNGLIIDVFKEKANLTIKLEAHPTFTNKTIQSHFRDLNLFVLKPSFYLHSKLGARNTIIQNQCDYKHFYDEVNKAHHCPTIGNIDSYLHDGVYFILQGCSSIKLGKPEEITWIITDRDEVDLFHLKYFEFSKRVILDNYTSCMEVCQKFCEDHDQPFEIGIKDWIIFILFITFCGILICYSCYIFLRKIKVSICFGK